MGNKGDAKESFHYRKSIRKLIQPFVTTAKVELLGIIAGILDFNDDDINLEMLRKSNLSFVIFSDNIKAVRKALREKEISKDAPWFKTLEKRMIMLEIFIADADHEMDIEKGRKDLENMGNDIVKSVKKAMGSNQSKSGSDKK